MTPLEIIKNLSLEDLPNEKWVFVINSNNKYMVSNFGRIKSVIIAKNRKKQIIMKQRIAKNGYFYISLSINKNIAKTFGVHRVVMESFYGKSKMHVDHLNMNKLDNRVENLEFVTPRENNARFGNSVRVSGVFSGCRFDSKSSLFEARIGINRKAFRIGYYKSKQDAILAYTYFSKLHDDGVLSKDNFHSYKKTAQDPSRSVTLRRKLNKMILEFNGQYLTISEWRKKLKCKVDTIIHRMNNNISLDAPRYFKPNKKYFYQYNIPNDIY